jgi:hypothetical protein
MDDFYQEWFGMGTPTIVSVILHLLCRRIAAWVHMHCSANPRVELPSEGQF